MIEIKELIKEVHGNAVAKGFYDCPKCEGKGYIEVDRGYKYPDRDDCELCENTGIDPNKNIGELLMLIVSELGEALEAHRCGRFARLAKYEQEISINVPLDYTFERMIKDTFEDEIADVFIRLFDLCGYLGIDNLYSQDDIYVDHGNIGNLLLRCTTFICAIFHVYTWDKKRLDIEISRTVNYLFWLCEIWEIPIEKHIKAKMAYNRTRPHKHGKEY